jgi:hypothetical protein
MHGIDRADLVAVVAATRTVPSVPYPGGWRGEIEAALIDADLSIRARYGAAETGVRGSIKRYRDHVGARLNDLERSAAYEPTTLATVLANQQASGGQTKATAIVGASRNLTSLGVRGAGDLDPCDPTHRAAYTRVRGLGWVTWDYFLMNVGHPGVKADTWVIRWVESVLGRASTGEATRDWRASPPPAVQISRRSVDGHRRRMTQRGQRARASADLFEQGHDNPFRPTHVGHAHAVLVLADAADEPVPVHSQLIDDRLEVADLE